MEVVALNDFMDPKSAAHLFKYDSVHKTFKGEVSNDDGHIYVNGHPIIVLNEKKPALLPWKSMDIDVVIEATGKFVTKAKAKQHIDKAGAKKVIIAAPAKGQSNGVKYVVLGVNDHVIDKDDTIISNSSCTTNNVAPLVKILDENWGIQKGFITTVHSYTTDQNIIDGYHKDLRRGRAAAYSIVPTTTQAWI